MHPKPAIASGRHCREALPIARALHHCAGNVCAHDAADLLWQAASQFWISAPEQLSAGLIGAFYRSLTHRTVPNAPLSPCREYANFRVSSDGEVQGVGLLIAADPTSGKLVVLAPIQGGPADRAGIKPGDEVSSHLPAPACRPARSLALWLVGA